MLVSALLLAIPRREIRRAGCFVRGGGAVEWGFQAGVVTGGEFGRLC